MPTQLGGQQSDVNNTTQNVAGIDTTNTHTHNNNLPPTHNNNFFHSLFRTKSELSNTSSTALVPHHATDYSTISRHAILFGASLQQSQYNYFTSMRNGILLSKGFILKSDHVFIKKYPSLYNFEQNRQNAQLTLHQQITQRSLQKPSTLDSHPPQPHHLDALSLSNTSIYGAPTFRTVDTDCSNVSITCQPSVNGIRGILNSLSSKHQPFSAPNAQTSDLSVPSIKTRIIWINVRGEPLIYLSLMPFSLRKQLSPYENLTDFHGIGERINRVERRLKLDILNEINENQYHKGLLLIHYETPSTGELVPFWCAITNTEDVEADYKEDTELQKATAQLTESEAKMDQLSLTLEKLQEKYTKILFAYKTLLKTGKLPENADNDSDLLPFDLTISQEDQENRYETAIFSTMNQITKLVDELKSLVALSRQEKQEVVETAQNILRRTREKARIDVQTSGVLTLSEIFDSFRDNENYNVDLIRLPMTGNTIPRLTDIEQLINIITTQLYNNAEVNVQNEDNNECEMIEFVFNCLTSYGRSSWCSVVAILVQYFLQILPFPSEIYESTASTPSTYLHQQSTSLPILPYVAVDELVGTLSDGYKLQKLINYLLYSTDNSNNIYTILYNGALKASTTNILKQEKRSIASNERDENGDEKQQDDDESLYTNLTQYLKRYMVLITVGSYLLHITRLTNKSIEQQQRSVVAASIPVNPQFAFITTFLQQTQKLTFSMWFYNHPHVAKLILTATIETTPFFSYSHHRQLVSSLLLRFPYIDKHTAIIWGYLLKNREKASFELLKSYTTLRLEITPEQHQTHELITALSSSLAPNGHMGLSIADLQAKINWQPNFRYINNTPLFATGQFTIRGLNRIIYTLLFASAQNDQNFVSNDEYSNICNTGGLIVYSSRQKNAPAPMDIHNVCSLATFSLNPASQPVQPFVHAPGTPFSRLKRTASITATQFNEVMDQQVRGIKSPTLPTTFDQPEVNVVGSIDFPQTPSQGTSEDSALSDYDDDTTMMHGKNEIGQNDDNVEQIDKNQDFTGIASVQHTPQMLVKSDNPDYSPEISKLYKKRLIFVNLREECLVFVKNLPLSLRFASYSGLARRQGSEHTESVLKKDILLELTCCKRLFNRLYQKKIQKYSNSDDFSDEQLLTKDNIDQPTFPPHISQQIKFSLSSGSLPVKLFDHNYFINCIRMDTHTDDISHYDDVLTLSEYFTKAMYLRFFKKLKDESNNGANIVVKGGDNPYETITISNMSPHVSDLLNTIDFSPPQHEQSQSKDSFFEIKYERIPFHIKPDPDIEQDLFLQITGDVLKAPNTQTADDTNEATTLNQPSNWSIVKSIDQLLSVIIPSLHNPRTLALPLTDVSPFDQYVQRHQSGEFESSHPPSSHGTPRGHTSHINTPILSQTNTPQIESPPFLHYGQQSSANPGSLPDSPQYYRHMQSIPSSTQSATNVQRNLPFITPEDEHLYWSLRHHPQMFETHGYSSDLNDFAFASNSNVNQLKTPQKLPVKYQTDPTLSPQQKFNPYFSPHIQATPDQLILHTPQIVYNSFNAGRRSSLALSISLLVMVFNDLMFVNEVVIPTADDDVHKLNDIDHDIISENGESARGSSPVTKKTYAFINNEVLFNLPPTMYIPSAGGEHIVPPYTPPPFNTANTAEHIPTITVDRTHIRGHHQAILSLSRVLTTSFLVDVTGKSPKLAQPQQIGGKRPKRHSPLNHINLKDLVDLLIDYADLRDEKDEPTARSSSTSELFITPHQTKPTDIFSPQHPQLVTNLRELILVYMSQYQKLKQQQVAPSSSPVQNDATNPSSTAQQNATPAQTSQASTAITNANSPSQQISSKSTKKQETVLSLQLSRALAVYALVLCVSAYLRDITSKRYDEAYRHWIDYSHWLRLQRTEFGEEHHRYDFSSFPLPPQVSHVDLIMPSAASNVAHAAKNTQGDHNRARYDLHAFHRDNNPHYKTIPSFSSWLRHHKEVNKLLTDIFITPHQSSTLVQSILPQNVILNRNGAILGPQYMLKSDTFLGVANKKLGLLCQGAINFRIIANNIVFGLRKAPGFNVAGIGIPSLTGMLQLLRYLTAIGYPDTANGLTLRSKRESHVENYPIFEDEGNRDQFNATGNTVKQHFATYLKHPENQRTALNFNNILWLNLREEPDLYVNNSPYVLRLVSEPFRNLETTGITSAKVIKMEEKLKHEAVYESRLCNHKLFIHYENDTGDLCCKFVDIKVGSIAPISEVEHKPAIITQSGFQPSSRQPQQPVLLPTPTKTLSLADALKPATLYQNLSMANHIVESRPLPPQEAASLSMQPTFSIQSPKYNATKNQQHTILWSTHQQEAFSLLSSFKLNHMEQLYDTLPSIPLPPEAYTLAATEEATPLPSLTTAASNVFDLTIDAASPPHAGNVPSLTSSEAARQSLPNIPSSSPLETPSISNSSETPSSAFDSVIEPNLFLKTSSPHETESEFAPYVAPFSPVSSVTNTTPNEFNDFKLPSTTSPPISVKQWPKRALHGPMASTAVLGSPISPGAPLHQTPLKSNSSFNSSNRFFALSTFSDDEQNDEDGQSSQKDLRNSSMKMQRTVSFRNEHGHDNGDESDISGDDAANGDDDVDDDFVLNASTININALPPTPSGGLTTTNINTSPDHPLVAQNINLYASESSVGSLPTILTTNAHPVQDEDVLLPLPPPQSHSQTLPTPMKRPTNLSNIDTTHSGLLLQSPTYPSAFKSPSASDTTHPFTIPHTPATPLPYHFSMFNSPSPPLIVPNTVQSFGGESEVEETSTPTPAGESSTTSFCSPNDKQCNAIAEAINYAHHHHHTPSNSSLLTCEEVWTWVINRICIEHALLRLPIPYITYMRAPVTDEQAPIPVTINDIIYAVCQAIVHCPIVPIKSSTIAVTHKPHSARTTPTIVSPTTSPTQPPQPQQPQQPQQRYAYDISNLLILQNCQMGRGRTTSSMIITALVLDALYDLQVIYNSNYSHDDHVSITNDLIQNKIDVYEEIKSLQANDEADLDETGQPKKAEKQLTVEQLAFKRRAEKMGLNVDDVVPVQMDKVTIRNNEEGYFSSVRKLITVLPQGFVDKHRCDIIIDSASEMQNLRLCLQQTLELYNDIQLFIPAQAHLTQERGENYLIRYLILILIASYCYQGGALWYLKQAQSNYFGNTESISSNANITPIVHPSLTFTHQDLQDCFAKFAHPNTNIAICDPFHSWFAHHDEVRHILSQTHFPDF